MKDRVKPRLLIIGHARHGKDTVASLISEIMGLSFTSSSLFVGQECVWDAWGKERYSTFQEMFDDRVNFRSTWKNLILAYNTPDLTRTARTMLDRGFQMYVGMRDRDEFEANMKVGTFDRVIWVDRHDHLPDELVNSMELSSSDANLYIDNNGTEAELRESVLDLQKLLHNQNWDVNYHPDVQTPKPVSTTQPSNKLIFEPMIFAIGQTRWNKSEFLAWTEFNKFNDMSLDDDTPLGRLWRDVDEDDAIARMIEFGGRHCYRAWEKGRSRTSYIKNILDMEHGSVLEHATINWAIRGVSRSLSLELARHRVGIALSQESQRYVDAGLIDFVVPPILRHLAGSNSDVMEDFHRTNIRMVDSYKALQEKIVLQIRREEEAKGIKGDTMAQKRANEAARALLPNDTETRLLWSTNMRLLRHFLFLRGGSGADLEIRRLSVALLKKALVYAPEVFGDMETQQIENGYGVPIIVAKEPLALAA